jgi:CheY-like chemotaxis protein
VREDAPVRIYCFIEDLFFLAKIQETARKLGVKVEFVKGSDKEAVTRVLSLPEGERPTLVVFDLNNVSAKPITLIPKFKTKYKKTVSVIGFLSHLQGELKMKASEVGCDTVMPRSAFSQSLPNLLRRYGVEEEEEDNTPQPV